MPKKNTQKKPLIKKIIKKKNSIKKTKKAAPLAKKLFRRTKEKIVGKIIHYFNHLKVGIIKVSNPVEIGDLIRVIGGEADFKQKIVSMEIDHKKIKLAKKGDIIGLKLKEKAREGYKVYKA